MAVLDKRSCAVIGDIGIGLIAGYVATPVMERAGGKLYELEPEEDRKREDTVRPGAPFEIAARQITQWLGLQLNEQQVGQLGMLFHIGLGAGWGPVYTLLRRLSGRDPVTSGLATGLSLWILIDEGLTPAMGWSAPNPAYPLVTHARALVAHLVYGLAVALAAELLNGLCRAGTKFRSRR